MKPIWFFVGLLLLVMGLIILAAGIYYIFHPEDNTTVLRQLHPAIWWGGLMTASGILFVLVNKNKVVQ
ncbi:MAG TPA: hypothetical protein VHO03_10935 [Ignavibacteriales bacterium]|nr:hypothetical protein [Ignavibacteriales bacterium]